MPFSFVSFSVQYLSMLSECFKTRFKIYASKLSSSFGVNTSQLSVELLNI